MNGILITNNPMADKKYSGIIETVYLENADFLGVLCAVRDKIHVGGRLLTHPLSGSVKPGQTNYKSIVITKGDEELDIESLEIIESSISMSQKILEDAQLIDLELIAGAVK